MDDFEAGTKIQYRLFDKKGKEHWFNGLIHAVKKFEDKGFISGITYLVDTGRDERVDHYQVDRRSEEIDKRVNRLTRKGATILDAINEVAEHKDLPKKKIEVEAVRQPEQIELPAEHIRPA